MEACVAPPAQPTTEAIAAICRQAVCDLLEKLQFDVPRFSRDLKLESGVAAAIHGWGPDMLVVLRPYIPAAITITIACYDHMDNIDARVQIALFGTLVIAVDDPSVLGSPAVRDFHRRLCLGSVQGDVGVVGRLMEIISGMWEFYPEFSASSIFTSALQFVNGSLLEQISGSASAPGSEDALPFIAYRRNMSGIAEAFAYFIWDKQHFPDIQSYMQAIPDICWFQNHVNDILSFYKEELAGETGNYMGDRARATGKTVQDTLQDVIGETIVLVDRIRRILGDGPVRDAWESFARGWIAFHIQSPRYRLAELIDCEYITMDNMKSA